MADISDSVRKAKKASIELAASGTDTKNDALRAMADALDTNRDRILKANGIDMKDAEKALESGEMSRALYDRLRVTDDKISGMIAGIEDVIGLDDPVGGTISTLELDDGLILYQVRCPIGVLGIIFESRPDVVPQIMSLCLKSGNAVAFKGGREATASNKVLFDILSDAAASKGVPKDAFCLMEGRADVGTILGMDEYIDLLIPRGSNSFVKYIQENTKIPVLGHAAGICHVYVDSHADTDKALKVVLDSKVQYPAVCNAVETLIVNSSIAEEFLPKMAELFKQRNVEIRADTAACDIIGKDAKKASETDWDEEYNDMIISIKTVDSVDEAINFINTHGSGHTDAIISQDKASISKFVSMVDSAGVFVNASTRFADGYRYGKGAEVGISTNKIHARGPVGMEGLMIYKYILVGDGHAVKDYVGGNARKFTHRELDRRFGV